MAINKQYPDIHYRLLELGFTIYWINHTPGETRWVHYKQEGKTWSLVWSINNFGEFWKAEYMTPYVDTFIYQTAADAIEKGDKHPRVPVEKWRIELAKNIRIFETHTNQVELYETGISNPTSYIPIGYT